MTYGQNFVVAAKNGQRSGLSPLENENGLTLGGGLAGMAIWSSAWPVQDIVKQSHAWREYSGTGAYTLTRKDHITNIEGDRILQKYVAVDVQDSTLPMAGTYTIRVTNASANLGYCVSNGAPPGFTGWTTATETTWNHVLGQSIILFVRSSDGLAATLSGIKILVPNFVEGQTFRTEWLNFVSALNLEYFRFMDLLNTNTNLCENWADRTTRDALSWANAREGDTFLHASDGTVTNHMPFDVCCELCNLLGVNMWLNIPNRASDDFSQQLGSEISSELVSSRQVILEHGNEQWNYVFNETVYYTAFFAAEKRTATGTPGSNRATTTGTPPTEGQRIFPMVSEQAKTRYGTGSGINFSTVYRAINVSGNQFDLVTDDGNDTPVNFETQIQAFLWSTIDEFPNYGNIEDINEQGGARAVQVWTAFETGLGGTHTTHRALGVQFNYLNLANRKAGINGTNGQHDFIAAAPYFDFNDEYVQGMTNAQLAGLDNTAASNALIAMQALIDAHPNVICYEWNNHTVPLSMADGTQQERLDALVSYYKSAECISLWTTFLQSLANMGVTILCFFQSDVGNASIYGFWSIQDDWGNPENPKQTFIRNQNGFIAAT